MKEDYKKIADTLEERSADYAIKSFDSSCFVDGSELYRYYTDTWNNETQKHKISNRTPIQHQRDKILYSNGLRKQSEKYHVLYGGGQRIIRNYITHTMRMMQVAKTICRALSLNEDFAEAVVLGSKIGASPFLYAAKGKISKWIKDKITKIDEEEEKKYSTSTKARINYPQDNLLDYPMWMRQIKNKRILSEVEEHIPFAIGKEVDEAYSSGKQGYWFLTTNPYTLECNRNSFTPELMYAIWRHSLNSPVGKDSFSHKQKIKNSNNIEHIIEWKNISFESLVVQYADDITWVIENLNDAHIGMTLNNPKAKGLFYELSAEREDFPSIIVNGLSRNDSGLLYTYFINDFIEHSRNILNTKDGLELKSRLRNGESGLAIGLSPEGYGILNCFIDFLKTNVFEEKRVLHRTQILEAITKGCLDLIFEAKDDFLKDYIERKGHIEAWGDKKIELAKDLLNDEIHRIQVTVNIFSELSDQEIYSFTGMDPF